MAWRWKMASSSSANGEHRIRKVWWLTDSLALHEAASISMFTLTTKSNGIYDHIIIICFLLFRPPQFPVEIKKMYNYHKKKTAMYDCWWWLWGFGNICSCLSGCYFQNLFQAQMVRRRQRWYQPQRFFFIYFFFYLSFISFFITCRLPCCLKGFLN